jgi:hypothetical protein
VLTPLVVDRSKARTVMEGQLSSALRKIVLLTQRTDHIPPITTNEANPFPYQVRTQNPDPCFADGVDGRFSLLRVRPEGVLKGKDGVLY